MNYANIKYDSKFTVAYRSYQKPPMKRYYRLDCLKIGKHFIDFFYKISYA